MSWICARCTYENSGDAPGYCLDCGTHSADATTAAPPPPPPPPPPPEDDGERCPECGRPLAPGARECAGCGWDRPQADPDGLALYFPWGPVPLRIGADLLLGREAGELTHELAPYETVGRRQVRIERDGDGVFATDLAATNPTYLNGERLTAHTRRRIEVRDTLALSTAVGARLEPWSA